MKTDNWNGCYDLGWTGIITPDAFSHPAKFSHGLIRKIYRHALAKGWLKPGDTVVDPFGGVALGALYAMTAGLNFVGVELEQRFVDMGTGCNCTGISKEDWVRFYNRWSRVAYRDGRHWCPSCLDHAPRIAVENNQASIFNPDLSASYIRNSGKIPYTLPHHYQGNIELFSRYAKNGARATLLQGDSRRLAEVLGRGDVVLSSPPYSKLQVAKGDGERELERLQKKAKQGLLSGESLRLAKQGRLSPHENANLEDYGQHPNQLANLPEGDPQAVISSPPFAGSVGSDDPDKRGGLYRDPKRRNDRNLTGTYGETEGQLGAMVEGVIGSPPYEGSMNSQGTGIDWEKAGRLDRTKPSQFRKGCQGDMIMAYGKDQANIGNDSGQTFWSAARLIVEQCHQILPPGGHAIWVVKDFVRGGQRVEFSEQWRQLCEAVGFRTLHVHRAWLVKVKGTQTALIGEDVELVTERKSFFRRLAERNGAPRIDWETVLCMERIRP